MIADLSLFQIDVVSSESICHRGICSLLIARYLIIEIIVSFQCPKFHSNVQKTNGGAFLFLFLQRKLLAVYLHHDSSILSNVFCSQILCSEGVVSFLSNNFLTWAWDMTHQTNSDRLVVGREGTFIKCLIQFAKYNLSGLIKRFLVSF